jgi:hypothetical protein
VPASPVVRRRPDRHRPGHQTELELQRARRRQRHDVDVEIRPLARYDALIPA